MKEKRQKNSVTNKQGMMTVRVEGQGRGVQNKADDATNPEMNEHGRRMINRHVNDAVSHIELDAKRIDLAHMTNPPEGMNNSEDHKREDEIVEDQK